MKIEIATLVAAKTRHELISIDNGKYRIEN